MSRETLDQYATKMDYETSDMTEKSLRDLYGDKYEEKLKELKDLSNGENNITIDEFGRRIGEEATDSSEESSSDTEDPLNPQIKRLS